MPSIFQTATLVMVLTTFPLLLLALAIPYAVLKVRDARGDQPDPQVGLKVGLYFFFSIGVVLLLYGLTTIVVDLLLDTKESRPAVERRDPFGPAENLPEKDKGPSIQQRIGWAMVVAGFVPG